MNIFLNKIISTLITVFATVTLVFFIIHLIPGDPIKSILGDFAKPAEISSLKQALGLDLPIWQQYILYLKKLLQFDFGSSIYYLEDTTTILTTAFVYSAKLALASILISILSSIPLGIITAFYKDSFIDKAITTLSMIAISIPNFVLGIIFILIFAIGFKILPVSGSENTTSIILPALTVGLSLAAILIRIVRTSILATLSQDYIRTAQSKGMSKLKIFIKHALPNAMLPIITVIGLQFSVVLSGVITTEVIFDWPGIGQILINAINSRDYPLIQSCVLIITMCYIGINSLTDFIYTLVDPRVTF